jgi:hypothetical protein
MTYASTSIDRRAIYYARAATVIAADPLDFYTRAEKGRRWQTSQFAARATKAEEIVSRYLSDVGRKLPIRGQVAA